MKFCYIPDIPVENDVENSKTWCTPNNMPCGYLCFTTSSNCVGAKIIGFPVTF